MAEGTDRRLTLVVAAAWDGEKIDTLLRRELGLSGTVIKRIKWLEDGILLDGVRAITGQRVSAGQVLSVRVAAPDQKADLAPTPGPVDVIYEDQDLLVVNKAPGVLVHPGPGHGTDTLCNHIAWLYRQRGEGSGVHPVQRLAVVQQVVDIVAVAFGAGHPAGRGVGLFQQAQPRQGRHLVAQRSAGHRHIKIVGKDAAAHRLALDAVEGHDCPQHTLLALIHCHAVLPPCLDRIV